MFSGIWWPFCRGFNVLTIGFFFQLAEYRSAMKRRFSGASPSTPSTSGVRALVTPRRVPAGRDVSTGQFSQLPHFATPLRGNHDAGRRVVPVSPIQRSKPEARRGNILGRHTLDLPLQGWEELPHATKDEGPQGTSTRVGVLTHLFVIFLI